ncbi:MAG TPA: hypothetical protein DC049_00300, partial [Spirochaetia bacterium]|nr:hypothetical protein [Spirochaetia bacterium]
MMLLIQKLSVFLVVSSAVIFVFAAEPEFKVNSSTPGNIEFGTNDIKLQLVFNNLKGISGQCHEIIRSTDFHGIGEEPEQRTVNLEAKTILTREIIIPNSRRGFFIIHYSLVQKGAIIYNKTVTGAILKPITALNPDSSPIGIYCHNIFQNGHKELPLVKNMGISWVRGNLAWRIFEREQEKWDWSLGDASYNALCAYKFNIYYNLTYPPLWRVKKVNSYGGNPENFADFAAYAEKVAARYPDVKCFSIWNEPDAASHWDGGASEFKKLLEVSYPVIKAANPKVLISMGGITSDPERSTHFINGLADADAGSFFDIYDYHYRNIDLHLKI